MILAFDGETAVRMVQTESPNLVVLDLMMPKRSGMEVLTEVRRSSEVPVIVLTALGDEGHVVDALRLGAGDYLVKPFRPRELSARAQALLRRSRNRAMQRETFPLTIRIGDVSHDPGTRNVTVGDRQVQLSRSEFSLLHYLMLNRNLTRGLSDIVANVWGYEAGENAEVVKVTVSRLRRKIEHDPTNPRHITNVPGLGYRFQLDE